VQHFVEDELRRQAEGDGQEGRPCHDEAVGAALEPFAIDQRALEAMLGGGGGEEDQADQGAKEGGEVDVAFLLADLVETAIERQDDQEGGEHLRAGQQDAQFREQIAEVAVPNPLVVPKVIISPHHLVVAPVPLCRVTVGVATALVSTARCRHSG